MYLTAGFELFTDLADFLVTCTPYVSKVIFQYVPPAFFDCALTPHPQPETHPMVRI